MLAVPFSHPADYKFQSVLFYNYAFDYKTVLMLSQGPISDFLWYAAEKVQLNSISSYGLFMNRKWGFLKY